MSSDEKTGEPDLTEAVDGAVADAQSGNWVDRYAPEPAKPYLRLMRADRPIGVWLLLWPCWWSLALSSVASQDAFPNIWYMCLFAIGAIAMRGAGCTYNDIVDKDIDAQVARTKSRPLPSGAISLNDAKIFLAAQCFVGFLVLMQFNFFAIVLGLASLVIVAVYPFMKRYTSWPQVILGLAFSWGALMGWAAVFAGLDLAPVMLYLGAVTWTVGYDTIYAHQDKEDDAMLGLGSTAIAFGENTKLWLSVIYSWTIVFIAASGLSAGARYVFIAGMAAAAAHLAWQVRTLDIENPANCLTRFRANRDFGAIIFAAFVADAIAAKFL